jgi:uncharacterized protein (DUF2344 family)
MGKHEPIKPSSTARSTERVRKHRAEMRAKGLRLRQVWTPDANDPAFLAEIAKANAVIAAHPEEEEDVMHWIEWMTTGDVQTEPD